jgi:hypothetical protein
MSDLFPVCVDRLTTILAARGVELQSFGEETLNPGVKFDFDANQVAVHGALWSNLSLDVEAVSLATGEALVTESVQVDGPQDLERVMAVAFAKLE